MPFLCAQIHRLISRTLPIPTRRLLNGLLKLLLVGLIGWALYQQVLAGEDQRALWANFLRHFGGREHLYFLVAAVGLVPINWALETAKFRFLIRAFTTKGFWESYRIVLAGVAVSIFTPNRVGEYGGRVLLVEARYNWKVVVATLVGSLAQLLALLCGGLTGGSYFLSVYLLPDEPWLPYGLVGLGALVAGLLFLYFRISTTVRLTRSWPFPAGLRRYLRHLIVLRHYRKRELLVTLGYGLLRYLTYCTQYYLLLRFYGIGIDYPTALAGAATIYLIHSGLPLPPVVGFLARGNIAILVWGIFTDQDLDILAASYSLFTLNLALPALIGAVFILQTNLLKSLGYGSD